MNKTEKIFQDYSRGPFSTYSSGPFSGLFCLGRRWGGGLQNPGYGLVYNYGGANLSLKDREKKIAEEVIKALTQNWYLAISLCMTVNGLTYQLYMCQAGFGDIDKYTVSGP